MAKNKHGFTITEVELITEAHKASKSNCSAYVAHGWTKGETGTARSKRIGARRLHAATKLREKGVIVHVAYTQEADWKQNIVFDFFRLTPEWQARLDAEDAALEQSR